MEHVDHNPGTGFQPVKQTDTGISKKTIAVTPEAVVAMRKQLAKRGTPDAAIRVGIRGGGCSGYSYVIEFDDGGPRSGDLVLVFDGGAGTPPNPPAALAPAPTPGAGAAEAGEPAVRVFCDRKSILYLGGSVLDWEKTMMFQGFKFKNPQEVTRCGCGHSFTV